MSNTTTEERISQLEAALAKAVGENEEAKSMLRNSLRWINESEVMGEWSAMDVNRSCYKEAQKNRDAFILKVAEFITPSKLAAQPQAGEGE